ncbi:hypothetical protein ILUMI_03396 [Ignelater luminosus]|uniref:Uncharacterized protein n=1 Tax=Ignelater luminosus TaxID=2038154 RepID=A0A8K0GM76_IGNLU|nr:hypothetical protein ILUMI_03396 [Ignelater luminosus]
MITAPVRSQDGVVLTNLEKVLDTWRKQKFDSELVNQPKEHRVEETETKEISEEGDITQEEADYAIGKMKFNKSASRDEIFRNDKIWGR